MRHVIEKLQEQVVQIDGDKCLTNTGRIFQRLYSQAKGFYWEEIQGLEL